MAAKATKALVDVDKLTKAQAKVEHMRLSLEIEAHNERYYQKDAPTFCVGESVVTRSGNFASIATSRWRSAS